jgi:hypothetical protein
MAAASGTYSAKKVQAILSSRDDWRTWYRVVKDHAKEKGVWEYFDPDADDETRPDPPAKPKAPLEDEVSEGAYRRYLVATHEWQAASSGIQSTNELIRETVALHIRELIAEKGTYEMLRTLKKQYAPTEREERLKALRNYNAVRTRPIRHGKISGWLNDFENAYLAIRRCNLPESDDENVKLQFLEAISAVSHPFAERHADQLDDPRYEQEDFPTLLGRYRSYLTNTEQFKSTTSSMAFATFRGQNDEASSLTESNTKRNTCICGKNHPYSKCWYIIRSKQPKWWKPNKEIEAKVSEAIAKDDKLGRKLKTMMEHDEQQNKDKDQKESNKPEEHHVMALAFSAEIGSSLKNCFILDSGASTHVCNDISRFETYNPSVTGVLHAGDTTMRIQGTGNVKIRPNCGGESGNIVITLTNVAYVPGLHTNIVGARKLKQAGYSWDFDNNAIKKANKVIFKLGDHPSGLWIVEQNGNEAYAFATKETRRSAKPLLLKGNMDIWHRRMAHTHIGALRHLSEAVTGIEIDDLDANHDIKQPCEDCKLANAPQQISRRPMMTATTPMERVHFDLIEMRLGLNGDKWITHFYDEATRMHFVITHQRKSECVDAIQKFVNQMKNLFGLAVKYLKSDNEKTLGRQITTFEAAEGIAHQYSVVATPNQNGAAERAGYLLIAKARQVLIGARLPQDLWPWIVASVANIVNRTPTKAIGWKTPLEMLTGKKPNLANLYLVGCIAYTRQQQEKGAKMAPRAYRGVLVGHVASNIWYIWNPKKQQVETARDVEFDETRLYNPSDPFVEDELSVSSPTPPVEIQVLPGEAYMEAINANIDLPEYITPNITQEESSNRQSTRNDEELAEIGGTGVEESWQEDAENYKHSARQTTPSSPPLLPTPDETPRPGNSGSNWMPGAFAEAEEQPEHAEQQRDDSPSRYLLESLQEEQNRASRETTSIPDADDPDSQASSRSGGGRAGRRRLDGLDTANIVEGRRQTRPRRDQADYQAHTAVKTPFIEEPERVEYAFAIALDAGENKKRWHRNELPEPPKNWSELLKHPLKDEFSAAARLEIGGLESKEAFVLVKQEEASDMQVLPLKWVFTYKFDKDGYFIKAKARICVRGDLEKDITANNYAATASARAFRAVMALVTAFDLDMDQKDAVNAFLNALLDTPVYTRTPDGFKVPGKIWKIRKALYGLRKSPRLWQRDLTATLMKFGLLPVPEEECLYSNEYMIVLVYVDDIIIVNLPTPAAREAAKRFKDELAKRYELRHMGEVGWFLGVRVLRDRPNKKLWLCQDSYIEHLAARFHLNGLTKWPETPLASSNDLSPNQDQATEAQIKEYQTKIGSIQYTAVLTRPDIAYAVSRLSEALKNPSPAHIQAANRVIAYLYATRFLAIEYSGNPTSKEVVMIASDAAFADRPDRRSSAGYLCKLYNGPIEWKSGKQRAVTTSTTEAEYLALSEAAKASYWWKRVFNTMGFDPQHQIMVYCDNQQTINMLTSENIEQRSKLRHVDIHRSWLRQEVQEGRLHVKWIPTNRMIADGLTKSLTAQKHHEFVRMLNLADVKDLILSQEGN